MKKNNQKHLAVAIIVVAALGTYILYSQGIIHIPGLSLFPNAQSGLSVGQMWIYSVSDLGTQYQYTVASISGSSVTLHYSTVVNGRPTYQYDVTMDLSNTFDPTGPDDQNVVIRANTHVGDLVCQDIWGTDGKVSQVVMMSFWGQARPTCVVHFSLSSNAGIPWVFTYYFDQATGVMCQRTVAAAENQETFTLTSTTIPEYGVYAVLLLIVLLTAATLVYARKMKKTAPFSTVK